MLDNYCIEIDGIDKSGKGIVQKYICQLSNYKYVILDRGLMSNIVFSKMYNRDYEYDIEQFKNWNFIFLYCDEEDWNIRCKITNEPKIDYKKNYEMFNAVYKDLEKKGFKTLALNTSYSTPYETALAIIRFVEGKPI